MQKEVGYTVDFGIAVGLILLGMMFTSTRLVIHHSAVLSSDVLLDFFSYFPVRWQNSRFPQVAQPLPQPRRMPDPSLICMITGMSNTKKIAI